MNSKCLHIITALILLLAQQTAAQVVINEVCYDNEAASTPWLPQCDWIEIYNPNDHSVLLLNWTLSDDSDDLDKFHFPDTIIAPLGRLLVLCTDENYIGLFLNSTFKMGNNEDPLFMRNASGTLIDALPPEYTPRRGSLARCPDGADNWQAVENPTPQAPNDTESIIFADPSNQILISHASGAYTQAFQLTATAPSPDWILRYTTDGDQPKSTSPIFPTSLSIQAESKFFDGIAYFETSDSWRAPEAGVAKHHVVRLRPYKDGIPVGPESYRTFLIHPSIQAKYPTHIASLILPNEYLVDPEIGIYVPGSSEHGNFAYKGDTWERKAHFTLLSNDPELRYDADIQIRIHGRSSRNAPQKNLRLYPNDQFEDQSIHLPGLRPNGDNSDYQNLILRAPEPLFSTTLFTNQHAQHIIQNLNIDSPFNQSCVLFINGVYWGVHHLEERMDKSFIEQHYGLAEDQIDLIDWDGSATIMEGDLIAFDELMQFLQNNSLVEAQNYARVEELVDVDSFIDYICAQVFLANEDFAVNNVRLWRERSPNGQWRFLFFDADATMRQHWQNRLEHLLNPSHGSDPVYEIFHALSQNTQFLNQFFSRFIYHLNTTFTPENLIEIWQKYVASYRPLVAEHVRRWHRPESMAEWENAVEQIKQFALQRPSLMTDQLNQKFKIPFTLYPNPCDASATLLFHAPLTTSSNEVSSFFKITLRNSLGQPLQVPIIYNNERALLDTNHLNAGTYLLEIQLPMMTYTHRMIVLH
jgi:CotH kinase protein/Lamin Tail Domain/Chitobiase/beta-hexosaminidase C-terminal domain